jgi:hypothetical protein
MQHVFQSTQACTTPKPLHKRSTLATFLRLYTGIRTASTSVYRVHRYWYCGEGLFSNSASTEGCEVFGCGKRRRLSPTRIASPRPYFALVLYASFTFSPLLLFQPLPHSATQSLAAPLFPRSPLCSPSRARHVPASVCSARRLHQLVTVLARLLSPARPSQYHLPAPLCLLSDWSLHPPSPRGGRAGSIAGEPHASTSDRCTDSMPLCM